MHACAFWLTVSSLTAAGLSQAVPQSQPPHAANEPRVGVFFWHDSPNDEATFRGVQLGLARAGAACTFVERRADSDQERAHRMLQELHDAHCDAVLALGTQATLLTKAQLHDVPIVFAAVTNPVTAGIVADWQQCGPNLCGASNWIHPRNVIDVFRLAVPRLQRLGIVRSADNGVVSAAELQGMRDWLALPAAPAITVVEAIAADEHDLPRAVRELLAAHVDALWIPIDITVYSHVDVVARALDGAPLPIVTTAAAGVSGGALVGAGVDYRLHGQRAAALLLDVLRSGRVPERPVDRMHSSRVVVNLRAAHRAGIELPLSLLAIADELIAPEPADARPR